MKSKRIDDYTGQPFPDARTGALRSAPAQGSIAVIRSMHSPATRSMSHTEQAVYLSGIAVFWIFWTILTAAPVMADPPSGKTYSWSAPSSFEQVEDTFYISSPQLSSRSPILRTVLLLGDDFDSSVRRNHGTRAWSETTWLDSGLKNRPRDPWLAFDKVQHLTFSFLWTLASQYTLVNKLSLSEGQAVPLSVGSSALIGVSKEYYDWKAGPTSYFSKRDLVADALGIILATGVILM